MTEYERGFIDGIKSKVSAELTPTLINVSRTMLEMFKPVLSSALENALNDNKAITDTDVQPVKRGRWIDCTFYDPCEKSWEQDFEFECSNCGHKIYNKPNDNNLFCGHCSARMDRGADDENS